MLDTKYLFLTIICVGALSCKSRSVSETKDAIVTDGDVTRTYFLSPDRKSVCLNQCEMVYSSSSTEAKCVLLGSSPVDTFIGSVDESQLPTDGVDVWHDFVSKVKDPDSKVPFSFEGLQQVEQMARTTISPREGVQCIDDNFISAEASNGKSDLSLTTSRNHCAIKAGSSTFEPGTTTLGGRYFHKNLWIIVGAYSNGRYAESQPLHYKITNKYTEPAQLTFTQARLSPTGRILGGEQIHELAAHNVWVWHANTEVSHGSYRLNNVNGTELDCPDDRRSVLLKLKPNGVTAFEYLPYRR